jgi:hypothetical protein
MKGTVLFNKNIGENKTVSINLLISVSCGRAATQVGTEGGVTGIGQDQDFAET